MQVQSFFTFFYFLDELQCIVLWFGLGGPLIFLKCITSLISGSLLCMYMTSLISFLTFQLVETDHVIWCLGTSCRRLASRLGRQVCTNCGLGILIEFTGISISGSVQSQVPSPKVKTKMTLADTKITWATHHPATTTPNF